MAPAHRNVIRLMANCDIIDRMIGLLDDYEAGRIQPTDVERSMEMNIRALEALPYAYIKQASTLCYRLVAAHLNDGPEEFPNEEVVTKVLAEFRQFLASLPGAKAG